MSKLWKELRNVSAQRTGVPAQYDYEDMERIEVRRGAWLVLIAFAMILQMEADNESKGKKSLVVGQSASLWDPS